MNYDLYLQNLIKEIQADKTLTQPYKNIANTDAHRLQSVLRMAKVSTNLQPPLDAQIPMTNQQSSMCICPQGVIDKACPVHGSAV